MFVLLFLCCGPAEGFDSWKAKDYYLEGTWQILHAIDWRQTKYAERHPESFREVNPLVRNIDLFFLGTAILHPVITAVLPKECRDIWHYISIGIAVGIVGWNFSIGVKF